MAVFTARRREAELMDDPALDEAAHRRALRGLARINVASRTAAALWPEIARIAASRPGTGLSLLDVACGGGDVAATLARRARRRGIALQINACDVSGVALKYASERAAAGHLPIRFFRLDAVADPLPAHYDIAVTTLFLHHLANAEIAALLKKLAAGADHVLVSDLVRGPAGYALAWAGTRLLSTSRIVRVDGLRSLRAALSLTEARELAAAAGLAGARFCRVWPQRFLMCWSRPATGNAGRADGA